MEWKHHAYDGGAEPDDGLGNFLSGMETRRELSMPRCEHSTLETSLVEWKRDKSWAAGGGGMPLGNFLSGMETPISSQYAILRTWPWKLP